jgi:hypothetical protein
MRRFSPTLVLRILLASLVGTAFLAACDSTASAPLPPITASPTVATAGITYRPSINITRADYEAALNKWKAQGVLEYEITTQEISLRSTNGYPETFRVNGDDVTILQTILDSNPTPLTVHKSDLLPLENTVEGLFAHVDSAFDDAARRTSIDSQTIYEIQFDPTFGYVTSYFTDCHERGTSSADTSRRHCPTDTYARIEVIQFKVLRSSHLPTALSSPTALSAVIP